MLAPLASSVLVETLYSYDMQRYGSAKLMLFDMFLVCCTSRQETTKPSRKNAKNSKKVQHWSGDDRMWKFLRKISP